MRLSVDQTDRAGEFIKNHFEEFFKKFSASQERVRLPLNRLFLNFPYNTTHIWENDPFQSADSSQGINIDHDYASSLSLLCLKKLSNEKSWNDGLTFRVFIELLSVLYLRFYENHSVNANSFFEFLITGLKNRVGDRAMLVDRFFEEGRVLYKERKIEIDNLLNTIKTQMGMPYKAVKRPVEDWLRIVNERKRGSAFETDIPLIQNFVRDLVLDVAGKIDLSQKGLIKAISVVSEAEPLKDNQKFEGDTVA